MRDVNICTSCKGTKRLLGLGGIHRQCPNCNGIGWIENNTTHGGDVNDIQPISKLKRGRKPKIIQTNTLYCE